MLLKKPKETEGINCRSDTYPSKMLTAKVRRIAMRNTGLFRGRIPDKRLRRISTMATG